MTCSGQCAWATAAASGCPATAGAEVDRRHFALTGPDYSAAAGASSRRLQVRWSLCQTSGSSAGCRSASGRQA
eukprot:scaffold86829_cov33-Tisochrysis_lutea.AAC.1